MVYGIPGRLRFPPSALWVVPVCVVLLLAALVLVVPAR